jgi:hypothetical protein
VEQAGDGKEHFMVYTPDSPFEDRGIAGDDLHPVLSQLPGEVLGPGFFDKSNILNT